MNANRSIQGLLPRVWHQLGIRGLITRKATLNAVALLDAVQRDGGAARLLLNGQRECGKTAVLTHVTHVAYRSGWIVLPFADLEQLAHRYRSITGTRLGLRRWSACSMTDTSNVCSECGGSIYARVHG